LNPQLAPVAEPPFAVLKDLVVNSVSSEHSKRAYAKALEDFFGWWKEAGQGRPFSKAVVQEHRGALEQRRLAPSSINVRLAAVRKLAVEAADNGLLAAEVAAAAAGVRGVKRAGVRVGNWLTVEQSERLLALPDTSTLKGKRAERCSPSSSAAACAAPNSPNSPSNKSSSARDAGPSSTWRGREATSGPCPCLGGRKPPWTSGQLQRASSPDPFYVPSTRPAGSPASG
jgi:hypothetical protein